MMETVPENVAASSDAESAMHRWQDRGLSSLQTATRTPEQFTGRRRQKGETGRIRRQQAFAAAPVFCLVRR